MINLDFLTLKAFLTENIDFLIGARIQKIQQPTRRDFIFSLRNNSESRKLYINIHPSIYHIAFMSAENETKRWIKIPKQPPMFCMLLRKYLEGFRILDACVKENERILELHFETLDETGEPRSLCLAIELMGKHSNVILYDRNTMIIIGCAHNVGADKSRYRELKGGLKYIYPPQKTIFKLPEGLKRQFNGLTSEKINYYLQSETFSPAILEDKYTLFAELLENSIRQNSVNEMIDNYYADFQFRINFKNKKDRLCEIVNAKLKKNKNSIAKIETLLAKRSNDEKYKLFGELLTANLFIKADYKQSIELYDYTNNVNVEIELDETKTMNENAQRYFKLYSKFKNTKEKSSEILNNLKMEKDYLENILYSLESAYGISDLEEIECELGQENVKEKQQALSTIHKLNISGFDVYIGKNNRENDYIISKLAKDEDYWFHTKQCAGSHVLLKVNENTPNEAILYECAKLAREYSSAKQPSKVGVIYTKRKYIKKPPSAPLGYVTYKNETEILI